MGKIKDLPLNERPREKALKHGIKSLSDYELLAILIQSGTKNKSALDISFDLICHFKGLANIFDANLFSLTSVEGISNAKALIILAIKELFIRINENLLLTNKEIYIKSSKDVYDYVHLKIENNLQEKLFVIYLNNKNKVIYETILGIGDETSSIINIKLICKLAIEKYAKKVICCHNHPSGNSSPSLADIDNTFKMENALSYIQVKLLDHIVIGRNEYYSIMDKSKTKVV